jgi:methionyl-tRNA formyltransferase
MDEGMDSGPILAQEEEPVLPKDTVETLTWRLFQRGAGLMVHTLEAWGRGEARPIPQDHSLATYTRVLRKEDGEIDFSLPAARLEAQVRAYQPWPGAYTRWQGRTLKLLEASVLPVEAAAPGPADGPPGLVVRTPHGHSDPVALVTGEGLLGLRRLQLEGRRPVGAEEFLRGYPSFVGTVLPS